MDDDRRLVFRERKLNHTRDHLMEFAVIIASADALLALILGGRIAEMHFESWVAFAASTCILIASLLAVGLLYLSIQVGALLAFGALRVEDVALAFALAASQLALFLWPAHVLGQQPGSSLSELDGLRWWLVGYAAFCFVAPIVGSSQEKRRRRNDVSGLFPVFETLQKRDRQSARATSGVVSAVFVVSIWVPWVVLVGAMGSILASIMGIRSQARQLAALEDDPE